MNNIIIPNPEHLQQTQEQIIKNGPNHLHIITDFDRTLTYSQGRDNKKIKSVISVLREHDYLSKEYSTKAKALFEQYHPIEIDPNISQEAKKKSMETWWKTHNQLLLKSGLQKSHLEQIAESGIIRLREGTKELFSYTHKQQIPLVIFSSSGVGDTIQLILEKENLMYNNVYIITNKFKWDKKGNAIRAPSHVIHALNKDETSIQNFPDIYDKIKDRKNILLLGDSLGDIKMAQGSDYKNILKTGFLNPGEEKRQSEYEKNFDLIITGDSGLDPVNNILHQIK